MEAKAQKIIFTRYSREGKRRKYYRATVATLYPRNYRALRKQCETAMEAIQYGMQAVRRYNRLVDLAEQAG